MQKNSSQGLASTVWGNMHHATRYPRFSYLTLLLPTRTLPWCSTNQDYDQGLWPTPWFSLVRQGRLLLTNPPCQNRAHTYLLIWVYGHFQVRHGRCMVPSRIISGTWNHFICRIASKNLVYVALLFHNPSKTTYPGQFRISTWKFLAL